MFQFLKRLRLSYALYNFFHRKQLVHNLPVYKKYGIHKKYYSSVSSKDFAPVAKDAGRDENFYLDALRQHPVFKNLSAEDQQSLENFGNEGYAILRGFFSPQQVEEANAAVDSLLQKQEVQFNSSNKIMFAIRQSPVLKNIGKDERLLQLLQILLGDEPVLFQSINFLKGSEQETHSDSIHMTTFPLGKLTAAWIALEDIGYDNGPLHYYPKSHLLPYYLNSDYENEGNKWLIGDKSYDAYEQMIQDKIRESGLTKHTFSAQKGDILIWHANLFHGGDPHTNKNRTRKSMVLHYFGKNAVCYHEITQRPALMDIANS